MEFDVDDTSVDILSRRYDAGIRIGEWLERDMVAVKLSPGFERMIVGAPSYLDRFAPLRHPRDLFEHECIRYRFRRQPLFSDGSSSRLARPSRWTPPVT